MAVLHIDKIRDKVDSIPGTKQEDVINIHNRRIEEGIYMEKQKGVVSTREVERTWETYMNNGWLDGKTYVPGPFKGINNRWKNKPCYIIGSGPDLKIFIDRIGWDFLDGKHTIGINHTIESYDRFEWFMFLDRRFLKKTTYNLMNFKGKIFAQNNTGISSIFKDLVRFRCRNNNPSEKIENGLFSSRFSGLAALNLAIIAGANPIFLIGFGMGKDGNSDLFHFRKNYQGVGQRPKQQFVKYTNVYNYFKRFKPWYPAVVHVTAGKKIAGFKKMTFVEFGKKLNVQKTVSINKGLEPKIAHLSFSDDINIHADITRAIINKCYGEHEIYSYNHYPKNADLYITEHFISTNKMVNTFPYKNKTINIVHSMHCIPQGNFLKNIALTNAWAKFLRGKNVNNIKVIKGGIDIDEYENINIDHNLKVFGRLTRWSPGKIPSWWNRMVKGILDENTDLKCLMFIQMGGRGREFLEHKRMIYDQSCKINLFKGDFLKYMGIYIHANGSFRETMSHAVIEAMAAGLPIIYLREIAVSEVVGNAGIGVNNEAELKQTILKLMYDTDLRKSYGSLSKNRAKEWDLNNTVKEFDKLIKEYV